MSNQGAMTDNDAPEAGAPKIVFTMPSLRADSDADIDAVEESTGVDEPSELDELIARVSATAEASPTSVPIPSTDVDGESPVDAEPPELEKIDVEPFEHDDDVADATGPDDAAAQIDGAAPADADDAHEPDTASESETVPELEPDRPTPAVLAGGGFAPPTPDTRAEYMYALIELERERILAATAPKPGIVKRLRGRKK